MKININRYENPHNKKKYNKESKLKISIYQLFFTITIVSLYFLNNNREDLVNEKILNNILSVFTFVFITGIAYLFLKKLFILTKSEWITWLSLISIFTIIVFLRQYIIVHWIYLLVSVYIIKYNKLINQRFLKNVTLLTALSIILQLVFLRFNARPTLSFYDPNFSGYYIYCFYAFAWKLGMKKISIFIAILGLFTLSRNYLISSICFFILANWDYGRRIMLKFKFSTLLLIGYILVFILSIFFINNIDEYDARVASNTAENRMLEYGDLSNYYRFTANIIFINDFFKTPKQYLWGRNLEDYTRNVYKNAPHNSILGLVINYGILFSIFYLIILLKIFNRMYIDENIPFFGGLILYFLILGGGLWGFHLIWISFILKTNIKNI